MKWEYKLVELEMHTNQVCEIEHIKEDNEQLNKLGSEGWELVNIVEIGDVNFVACLKRKNAK